MSIYAGGKTIEIKSMTNLTFIDVFNAINSLRGAICDTVESIRSATKQNMRSEPDLILGARSDERYIIKQLLYIYDSLSEAEELFNTLEIRDNEQVKVLINMLVNKGIISVLNSSDDVFDDEEDYLGGVTTDEGMGEVELVSGQFIGQVFPVFSEMVEMPTSKQEILDFIASNNKLLIMRDALGFNERLYLPTSCYVMLGDTVSYYASTNFIYNPTTVQSVTCNSNTPIEELISMGVLSDNTSETIKSLTRFNISSFNGIEVDLLSLGYVFEDNTDNS